MLRLHMHGWIIALHSLQMHQLLCLMWLPVRMLATPLHVWGKVGTRAGTSLPYEWLWEDLRSTGMTLLPLP